MSLTQPVRGVRWLWAHYYAKGIAMTEHVYKVVEIVGTSEQSLSDAIERGIKQASELIHNMGWFEVTKISGHLENGKVGHYQVSLKLGFRVDGSGAAFGAPPLAGRIAVRRILASRCTGEVAMKLMWFHLMPYTELPEDFREKNPSVWVDIHSSLFDPKRAHLMYNEFMDEMEYAADCGFDAICCQRASLQRLRVDAVAEPDRQLAGASHHEHGDLRDGQLDRALQSADARGGRVRDDRLHLRRPADRGLPGRHADGRLLLLRPNPSMLRERYLEAHDLIMRAWTEQDTFAFNGRYNQQRYVNIWPRPVQKPHPPIWVPGGGSVETWQWCAKMDYVYCYLSYYGYKAGRATMQGFWDEMARLGKDRNPYRAGFLQFVGVGESRDHAMELYAEAAEYFYGRCLHVDPRFASPPGYMTARAGGARRSRQRTTLNAQVLPLRKTPAVTTPGTGGSWTAARRGVHRPARQSAVTGQALALVCAGGAADGCGLE